MYMSAISAISGIVHWLEVSNIILLISIFSFRIVPVDSIFDKARVSLLVFKKLEKADTVIVTISNIVSSRFIEISPLIYLGVYIE